MNRRLFSIVPLIIFATMLLGLIFPDCKDPASGGGGGGGCVNASQQPGQDESCGTGNSSGSYPAGPTPTAVPTSAPLAVEPPAFWRVYAGEYSYDDDACTIQKDPITTFVRQIGADIVTHVSHHGSPDGDDPTDPALRVLDDNHQHFFEVTRCLEASVSQANKDGSSGFFPFITYHSRWHVRCDINGAIGDPAGGTFAACTPHYDQAAGCGHVVPSVFGSLWPGLPKNPGGSGFDAGRDYLYYLLVTVGQHYFVGSHWSGNDNKMLQCDNVTWSGSDGYVNEIAG